MMDDLIRSGTTAMKISLGVQQTVGFVEVYAEIKDLRGRIAELERAIIAERKDSGARYSEAMAECNRLDLNAEALRASNAELVAALEPFAARRTIGQSLQPGARNEWADASVERRIELLGERTRKNDDDILRARAALASHRKQETDHG